MIAAFYEDLATGPAICLPVATAEQRWGAVNELVQHGFVQVVAAREGETWPDACAACERELHREGDRWLALCRDEWCDPIEVDARRARALPELLPTRLARVCGVGPAERVGHLHLLGERRVGRHAFLFVWCPSPAAIDDVHLDRLADDRAADLLVVLVPHGCVASRIQARRRGRTRIIAFGLDEVLLDPEALDLSEVWLRYRLGGVELLWPRYDLILDSERVLWAGSWVDLSRNPLFRVLVETLVAAGDRYVTRSELLPTLFPDELTNKGRMRTDPTKLDRRLRQLVSRVNAHFGAHPDGRLLVGNLRARSDIEGGYRIEVAPDRCFIFQEDNHV